MATKSDISHDPDDFLVSLHLLPYLRARLREWERNSKKIDILVTGKTGTGKSTLINGIVGREVAKQGDCLDPETCEVAAHSLSEGEITVNVYDSPGLQDGTNKEAMYLADMKGKCSDVDLVVYCIRMSEDRVTADCPDVKAMRLLTQTFGEEFWKNAIFMLTFANDILDDAELESDDPKEQQQYFNKQLEDWESLLRDRLQTNVGLPKELVQDIIIVPAGHCNQPQLPDAGSTEGESHWLSRIWLKALSATKPRAQLALIKLNIHRIRTNQKDYKHDGDIEGELVSKHRLIFTQQGADFGKQLGVPNGVLVGEVAGFISGLNSFVDSLVMHIALKSGIISPEDIPDANEPNKG